MRPNSKLFLFIRLALLVQNIASFTFFNNARTHNIVAFRKDYRCKGKHHGPFSTRPESLVAINNNGIRRTRTYQRFSQDDNDVKSADSFELAIATAGITAQPIIWASLYFVKTTGAGLPAGPFGFLGALEGVSYLIILGFVGTSLYRKIVTGSGMKPGKFGLIGAAEGLSYLSLLAGLFVLASLVADQGCVPNAKPILDYSNYLPICESTPGLFGE